MSNIVLLSVRKKNAVLSKHLHTYTKIQYIYTYSGEQRSKELKKNRKFD